MVRNRKALHGAVSGRDPSMNSEKRHASLQDWAKLFAFSMAAYCIKNLQYI
jgi:hypothetical protein